LAENESALNATYQQLLKTIPKEKAKFRTAVIASQRAWVRFRELECELSAQLTDAAPTWQSAYFVECKSRLAKTRAAELRQMLDALP